jgi:hypothetical protein
MQCEFWWRGSNRATNSRSALIAHFLLHHSLAGIIHEGFASQARGIRNRLREICRQGAVLIRTPAFIVDRGSALASMSRQDGCSRISGVRVADSCDAGVCYADTVGRDRESDMDDSVEGNRAGFADIAR